MKFSFVIPAYENYRLLHQLLYDIYRNCSPVHEVIIMDDGKDQETEDGIEWWMMTGMLPIKYERNKKNLGFLLNSNKGLKKATGDIVALVSTDVRIHKDLVAMGLALPEVQRRNGGKILLGGKLYRDSTGWNEFDGKIFPYVEGWLLIAENTTWKMLNYFDERFVPNDFEDIDLSTTASMINISLAQITPDAGEVVTHIGAQSIAYGPDRESITIQNKQKFENKWLK